MRAIDKAILPKHFDAFLPGFHGVEFLAIILLASFVLSGHPSLDMLPVIGGGLLGFYLLPRLFLFLAKKGLLGNNWNKEGLRNSPFK